MLSTSCDTENNDQEAKFLNFMQKRLLKVIFGLDHKIPRHFNGQSCEILFWAIFVKTANAH